MLWVVLQLSPLFEISPIHNHTYLVFHSVVSVSLHVLVHLLFHLLSPPRRPLRVSFSLHPPPPPPLRTFGMCVLAQVFLPGGTSDVVRWKTVGAPDGETTFLNG